MMGSPTHLEQPMVVSLEHFVHYHELGNDFLFRIVTEDESWVHHFTPEMKFASMNWKHPSSPVRKKFKTTLSASWEPRHHSPYNPDLAPIDFHLFPTLKKNLAGRHFGDNAEVKQSVKRCFRMQNPQFRWRAF
ncbi:histone-lysine N-methyltransferase SETMAR [Trichonephila clavipes]|uniref:Histone-lysine N-methyltransferase SETMAR n=1 Tax=Trichonephila clavipes TaxID=2585209 RepID=A0A8X6VNL4_TRICX|nr:histone-lysine N-methyltransferase SETMAR [Trichonephila clavipes]